jgi:type I restriction enzyme S subunit
MICLIENNLKRIKILEEMAQMIYREWFVNYRFPGHEKVKMVDSPLGKIPEGWEVKKFTDIADVLSGGTPKTQVPEYWNGHIPFFTPKDAPASFYVSSTEKNITEQGLAKCNSKLYPKDTVFITARGTVGKVVMPSVDMAMNQSCYALVGKERISQFFLFMLTMQSVEVLRRRTGGATFDTIIVDTFRRLDMIKPTEELIELFAETIEPIFDEVNKLLSKNTNLRKTRDLLLPKLISGELDVEGLDIKVPEETD